MIAADVYANQPAAADRLEALLPHIAQKSHEFAGSLIFWARNVGTHLSKGRAEWIAKLITETEGRIAKKDAPRTQVGLGDCSGINALFDRAKTNLKRPQIVIKAPEEVGQYIRLSVASDNAKVPGSINVVVDEPPLALRRDEADVQHWFGRVLADGALEVSPRFKSDARLAAVSTLVAKFAADPATGAKESARLTGKCVFCNTKIKDERSTAVGYGRVCSVRYGLPWA